MPYKVKVDKALCIGAASCAAVSPNAFVLDEEGKAVVRKKDTTTSKEYVAFADIEETEENLFYAAKACPVNAIVIVEVDEVGNEVRQVWPT